MQLPILDREVAELGRGARRGPRFWWRALLQRQSVVVLPIRDGAKLQLRTVHVDQRNGDDAVMNILHHIDVDAEMGDPGEGRNIGGEAAGVGDHHIIRDDACGAAEADMQMRHRHPPAKLR